MTEQPQPNSPVAAAESPVRSVPRRLLGLFRKAPSPAEAAPSDAPKAAPPDKAAAASAGGSKDAVASAGGSKDAAVSAGVDAKASGKGAASDKAIGTADKALKAAPFDKKDQAVVPAAAKEAAPAASKSPKEKDARPPGAPPDPWSAFAAIPEQPPGLFRRAFRALRRSIIHEYALVVYAACLLAAAMTWPTLRYPMHTLPQDLGDPSRQAWRVAWAGHAVIDDPSRLWQSNAYYPLRDSFAFGDSLFGYAFAGMIGSGPSAAVLRYNILFVLVHALLLIGAYALVRQLGARRTGAAVAAVAFAYAPWRLAQAGHLDIISAGGIPLALAMLARGHGYSLRHGFRPQRRRAGWAVAGWLVAIWQLTLGFSLGIPFAYVLGLLVIGLAVIGIANSFRQSRQEKRLSAEAGHRLGARPGKALPGRRWGFRRGRKAALTNSAAEAPDKSKPEKPGPEASKADAAETGPRKPDPEAGKAGALAESKKPEPAAPGPGKSDPEAGEAESKKPEPAASGAGKSDQQAGEAGAPAAPQKPEPEAGKAAVTDPAGKPTGEAGKAGATTAGKPTAPESPAAAGKIAPDAGPAEPKVQPVAAPLKPDVTGPAVRPVAVGPLGSEVQRAAAMEVGKATTPPGPRTDVLENPPRRRWISLGRYLAGPPRPARKPVIGWLLTNINILGATIFLSVGVLVAVPYIRLKDTGSRLEEITFFSPPLRSLLIGPAESRVWGAAHATPRASLGWAAEMSLLPGFALYALALAGLFLSIWRLRHRALLLMGLTIAIVLTLGTNFFGGRWTYLPLFGHFPASFDLRIPGRLMLWVTLLLAILAAGAVDDFVRRAEQWAAQRIPPWPGPWLRLATLIPLVLVTLEGWNTTAHPQVPTQPDALRTVPGPLLVLPTADLTDQTVQLWTTSKFQQVANGGGTFAAARQNELRAKVAGFPDATSIQYLEEIGVRKVLLLRDQVAGTSWEDAVDLPVDALQIRREDLPDAVVFYLN